jgi:hypothetical protein
MTAIIAHGTPVLAETAWYLALAFGATKWRATGAKFRISLALAQRFVFAAVRALRSVMLARSWVVVLNLLRKQEKTRAYKCTWSCPGNTGRCVG